MTIVAPNADSSAVFIGTERYRASSFCSIDHDRPAFFIGTGHRPLLPIEVSDRKLTDIKERPQFPIFAHGSDNLNNILVDIDRRPYKPIAFVYVPQTRALNLSEFILFRRN